MKTSGSQNAGHGWADHRDFATIIEQRAEVSVMFEALSQALLHETEC